MFSSLGKILYSSLLMIFIVSACAPATTATHPPPTQEPQPTPTRTIIRSQAEQDAWSEDLDFFIYRVGVIHPDPFYRVSEEEYLQAIDKLKSNLSTMTDEQIIVELARIVANMDGHSTIIMLGDPLNFQLYPLRLFLLSDGLFVIDAQEPYEDVIGGKVVQIGLTPVEDVIETVSPLVPNDNPMGTQLGIASWVMRPKVLQALGLIDSIESPQIVVKLPDGTQKTVNPAPVAWENYRAWSGGPAFGLPQRPEPLYLSRVFSDEYWFTYLEDSGTLYIQLNRIQGGNSVLAREIPLFLDQQEVERVVLDLRLNPGGDNTTYRNFLNLLTTDERINRPGRFFTILGRQTFSAASNFATKLENQTHTIFVGEPMGGSPNLFGDVAHVTLPNSRIVIHISAFYWQMSTPEDKRVWIEPDIPAPLSSEDFFNNIDPAMEAILAFDPQAEFTPTFNPILEPNPESDWEATDIRDPYVVEFEGAYYMFYAGQDADGKPSIGYATSQNGKKWFRAKDNPILTGSEEGFDSYGVTVPVIHREGDDWTMYYAAIETPNGRPTSIGQATASSLKGPWERSKTPVLTISESPAWDSMSVTPGSIVDVDGTMRLYYSGFSANQAIGIGFAESTDGITWTKHGNPVLPGGRPGDWDEIVYSPFVQLRNGVWEMYYHGNPFNLRGTNQIGLGLATSEDGVTWTRAAEPFLISSDEDRFPHMPAVLGIENYLYVYYASVMNGGGSSQIRFMIYRNL